MVGLKQNELHVSPFPNPTEKIVFKIKHMLRQDLTVGHHIVDLCMLSAKDNFTYIVKSLQLIISLFSFNNWVRVNAKETE